MPDEGAVGMLDAPGADAALETPAVGADTSSDTSTDDGGGGADAIDNADSPQSGETGHLRGSELYRAVKEKLKTGAALTPQEQRSIRNAIHIADKADKATNGNLDAFTAERAIFQKLADDPESGMTPEQIVDSTLQERQFWREFDDRFEKADPALIPQMIEANPASFQALAPHIFDEFAKVNPDGFSSYVARSAKGYLDSNGVPLQFAILETFLPSLPDFPGKERVIAAIQAIYGAITGLDAMAEKPITAKVDSSAPQAAGGIDQREQRLTEKESAITRYEWNKEAAPKGQQMRDSEMTRVAAAQKVTLSDDDKAKIRSAVKEEIDARLQANTKYGQAMRGYLQAGNKRAYVERAHSEYQKLIPSVTARHTQAIIDGKKSVPAVKKPAAQNGNGNQPQNRAQNGSNGNGNLVQWIAGHPRTVGKRVDLNRTTNSMLQRNEAYVMGEKALFKWKAKTL
jgi:hypothetical protein